MFASVPAPLSIPIVTEILRYSSLISNIELLVQGDCNMQVVLLGTNGNLGFFTYMSSIDINTFNFIESQCSPSTQKSSAYSGDWLG